MALIKDQITNITLDTMLGIREGVGEARVMEFREYVQDLIRLKEADIDLSVIPYPMLMDRVKQGVEAALSSKTEAGIEGGATWSIATLKGLYGKETQQGAKVKVDMEFMSVGSPDFARLQELSVEELKVLMEVVEPNEPE